MAELGDEVLLARLGDCRAEAAAEGCAMPSALAGPGVWVVRPKGSTPRGDGPLTPVAEEGVWVPAWLSGRDGSSAKPPAGKKAGLSLPYRARC